MTEGNSPPDQPSVEKFHLSKNHWIFSLSTFVFFWLLAIGLWLQADLDKIILFGLNNSNFSREALILNKFFSKYGMAVVSFIYFVYLVFSLRIDELKENGHFFLLPLISFAVAGISGDLLKEVFDRSRPIIDYGSEIIIFNKGGNPSFPSGHATKSVALVLPFLIFAVYKNNIHLWTKFIFAFIAVSICFARIFLGAHYLSDVLGGIGWAFFCLPFSVLASNFLLRKMRKEKLESALRIWLFVYLALSFVLTLI